MMRLRLGTMPSPIAVTAAVTPYLIASTLILGFVIVGLFLRPPTLPTLIVTPFTLDFGKLEVGQKVVKPVVIETSSVSNLTWKIVSGDPQWLNITKNNVIQESDNLSEVVYDVAANTSNLREGKYPVTYNIDVGGVNDQQEKVNFQVIPPTSKPLPAQLNVDPLTLDFGTQNVGSQLTKLLTVSDSGQMDLSWMADKGNATWLTLDMSQGKIAPGGQPKVIKVMVNPATLTKSLYSAEITFTSNGGTASVVVKLNVVVTPTINGPQVLGVSPSSGLNDGGTTVVITGTGLTDASMVSFGSVQVTSRLFTVNNDTQITVISPPANQIELNSKVDVTVTTPNGTSVINSADHFTYHAPLIPTVTKVSPNVGTIAGGTSVIITGTGFTGATAVSFGTTAVKNFTFISDTQIVAVSPAGSANNTVSVTVTTPEGSSVTNNDDQFTYLPSPTVTSINPTGFTHVTSVSFGTNITFMSDTQLSVISPAVTSCKLVDVTVTTPGGTSVTSTADYYAYCLGY